MLEDVRTSLADAQKELLRYVSKYVFDYEFCTHFLKKEIRS